MNGYRKMIESRIPLTWVIALKHCRCYKRYVEHVYTITAGRYNDDCMHTRAEKKKLKAEAIKTTFDSGHKINRFKYTLDMERIHRETPELVEYWERVISWVDWFTVKTPHIVNSAKNLKEINLVRGKKLREEVYKSYKNTPHKLVDEILTGYGLI